MALEHHLKATQPLLLIGEKTLCLFNLFMNYIKELIKKLGCIYIVKFSPLQECVGIS